LGWLSIYLSHPIPPNPSPGKIPKVAKATIFDRYASWCGKKTREVTKQWGGFEGHMISL
jgi:hypothetical protein